MLTSISLEHFKCFEKLHLPLAPLTLLSGLNAAGKSTVLQSLALLHQTAVESEWNTTLILNGATLALGSAGDVLDELTGRDSFSIGVESDTFGCTWVMQTEGRRELAVPMSNIVWQETPNWEQITTDVTNEQERIYHLLPESIWRNSRHAQWLSSTLLRMAYISADRIGPRETYIATTPDQQTNVGPKGEFTAWFLNHFAEQPPLDSLLLEGNPPTLLRQTEAWMNYFFPGASLEVKPVERANLLTIGIRAHEATSFHRPQNVGYGLTHILPILACCLGAKQGQIILIENPESHLHPAGQSEMGKFLARCAVAGIQVILETHSDHILNGIRRAVKEQRIAPESVAIHFFSRDRNAEHSQIISPMIDNKGTLDSWPSGFFDQFDTDVSALIDW